MSLETQYFYDFGNFRIDLAERTLMRGGNFIPVTPKVFETLCALIENAGRTVEKDELMQRIWQDRFVEESNLTFNIGMLRKALGDDAANPRFVETVPRRGYRFIAEVKRVAGDEFLTNGNYPIQFSNEHIANEYAVKSSGIHSLNGNSLDGKLTVETPPSKISAASRSRIVLYSMLAMILIGIFVAAGFFLMRKQPTFYERFGSVNNNSGFLSVEKMSDTGGLSGLNISPDGKLLIYNNTENGKNTIWLRQFASGKSVALLSAADETFHGIGFSRDGEFVFYTHQRKGEPVSLSRISTLGGTPTRIISGLHSGWTFSPDERQVAVARFDAQGNSLVIADADGQNERKLFTSPKSRYIHSTSWSPDGKSIAYCAGSGGYGGMDYAIYEYNLENGTEKSLTDFKWSNIENIKWLPDGSGLLLTAQEKIEDTEQIWRLSIPGGQVAPVTDDSAALSIRGASADFSRILATQTYLTTSVWIAPKADLSAARPISKAVYDVAWTRDGKIIFPTKDSVKTDIWMTTTDGGDKKQLTVNESLERSPAASNDGRFIVYVSTRNGRQNIWRMDATGANQTALTSGEGEIFPTFTPDGRWVVFTSNKDKSLWRVPVEGGAAEQISAARHRRVAISPDGTKLAHMGRVNNQSKLIIESFPDCIPIHEFDANSSEATLTKIVWAQDGKAVFYYVNDPSLIGNLWRQPLVGGEPQKLTNFTFERILDFAFSPDESQIALVRGEWNFDAVLLKGFK